MKNLPLIKKCKITLFSNNQKLPEELELDLEQKDLENGFYHTFYKNYCKLFLNNLTESINIQTIN